jgi:hypothetical protein
LKAHSGATQLKKDEKMAEKSLFGSSDQIANKLLAAKVKISRGERRYISYFTAAL